MSGPELECKNPSAREQNGGDRAQEWRACESFYILWDDGLVVAQGAGKKHKHSSPQTWGGRVYSVLSTISRQPQNTLWGGHYSVTPILQKTEWGPREI